MRYYDLDANGWPRADYARPQPDKDLRHLPERQSEHERWDEDKGDWVEDAASVAADWYARIESRADTELQFPTNKGIKERDADDLDRIATALDTYITAVWRRAAELQKKVSRGTISEDDLENWPE